jgi:hypothetical protein
MGKSADALAARQQAYKQLSARFPSKSISWVKQVRWDPVAKIDLDEFDTSSRTEWAASHEPKQVAREVQKWQDGTADPIIAIQVGTSPQLVIVDGHHRYIGRERMHKHRVLALVGHVPDTDGPWMETHLSQFGGASG